jgi:hypothetical protein
MPSKADPLRVSQTVKRMMENEEDYKNPKKGDDVELSSRDQEIIFGKDDNSPAKATLETIDQQ